MKLIDMDASTLRSKLQNYLDKGSTYKAVFEYTKQRFEDASELPAHNWAYAYRDTLNAIVVGETENADMTVVLPAITMHDIGLS